MNVYWQLVPQLVVERAVTVWLLPTTHVRVCGVVTFAPSTAT
jgi:hypothetical protein